MKTIVIHQGQGDDELEMTVQVTQAEFDKMEEIRSRAPLLWNGKELDLVKTAKELIMKEGSGEKEQSSKRTNWKLIIGVALGIVIIVGTIIFAENRNKKLIEESPQNTLQSPASNDGYYDNIHKLYLDAIERGLIIDEQTFYFRLFESDKSRRGLFFDMKNIGMKVNYEEFLNYIGLSIDWWQTLADFQATMKNNPNLTDKEWFDKFPEFDNRKDLLQAAFDYDATRKEKNYTDDELMGKFPEFWPDHERNSNINQNLKSLYDKLLEKKMFFGTIDDFKNSLMNESYRSTLFQLLLEKQAFEGSYFEFNDELGLSPNIEPFDNDYKRALYDILTLDNYDLGDYESFSQKINDDAKRRIFYDAVSEEYDLGSWEDFSNEMGVTISINDYSLPIFQRATFSSVQYGFSYQYDNEEYKLVDKINKNSHCVMKLQSSKDEIKSILISVWENSEFFSAYDSDFIASCQSVDQRMGNVIKSATKTKVSGVNALKTELKISPMGKIYYAAIYRFIHNKRMFVLNIYIPIDEYSNDKLYGDKCANNFKFN